MEKRVAVQLLILTGTSYHMECLWRLEPVISQRQKPFRLYVRRLTLDGVTERKTRKKLKCELMKARRDVMKTVGVEFKVDGVFTGMVDFFCY
jgi:hypothetical protein